MNEIIDFIKHHPIQSFFYIWGIFELISFVTWCNQDHIITEIDGKFYDIRGSVSNEGYLKYSEFYNKERMIKSFKQMYKYNYNIN
jgi:hypothetical protein